MKPSPKMLRFWLASSVLTPAEVHQISMTSSITFGDADRTLVCAGRIRSVLGEDTLPDFDSNDLIDLEN